jgi:hypothetical protein
MNTKSRASILINKYNSTFKSKGFEVSKNKITRTDSGRIKSNNLVFTIEELKNAETLDYWHLKVDKDRLSHKITEAKNILDRLNQDYGHYFDKTNSRETQIRKHIDNLDFVHAENIDKVKQDVASLIEDVNNNINVIEQKMKHDIDDKKRDIENRLNIRLMDSEYSHRMLLENKIKEQESFMRTLHSFTTEIIKIQNNYKKSKNQVISLLVNNEVLEDNITKNKKITEKLLKEMTNLKSVIFSIKNEIYLVYKLKNEESNLKSKEEEFNKKIKKIKNRQLYDSPKNNLLATGNKFENQRNLIKNSMSKINLVNPNKSKTQSNFFQSNINKEFRLLKYHMASELLVLLKNKNVYLELIQKFPRIEQSLKHLCNIMFGLSNKIRKVNKLIHLNVQCTNILKSTVYKITKNIKKQNYVEAYDKIADNKEIYLDKNFRKRFINNLVSNQDVLELFKDEKFPNITISNRQLKY